MRKINNNINYGEAVDYKNESECDKKSHENAQKKCKYLNNKLAAQRQKLKSMSHISQIFS